MQKHLLTLGAVAAFVGAAFGYSDDDLDANGNAFNDSTHYVQLLDNCGDWGCTALFNNASYWSDGLAPHAKSTTSPNDYYMPIWKYFNLGAHWGYAHQTVISEETKEYYNPETGSNFLNRVALGSLTIGSRASLQLLMGEDPVDYAYTFNDLRLRPQATVQMGDAVNYKGFCFKGNITILSEEETAPSLFLLGTESKPLYIKSNLIGSEMAQMRISGETGWGEHADLTGNLGLAYLQGDNSNYFGVIGVGANTTLLFGSDVNGVSEESGAYALVKVDGNWYDRFTYDQGSNTEHTVIGVCRTDKQPVTIAGLEVADGVSYALSGLLGNGGMGITCSVYYSQYGKVILDCTASAFDSDKYTLLTVPTDPENCVGFALENFELKNLEVEGYELKIVDNGDGTQSLMLNNPSIITGDYVELIKDDAHVEGKQSIAADYAMYTGDSYWEDGKVPSIADGPNYDYLIPTGYQLTMPISWAIASSGDTSAHRSDHLGKFYGKSLTIARGAALALGSLAGDKIAAEYYAFETDSLILMPGGQIHQDLNEWNNGETYMKNGTITIKGTESVPSLIWLSNNRTSASQQWKLVNSMGLAGDGNLRIAGGGAQGKENNGYYGDRDPHYPFHELYLNGDNTAFTGTIKVGPYTNTLVAYSPLWGNVTLLLGSSGVPNGSLIFDDGEPRLGIGGGANAFVPVKNLTLVEGNTLDVGTMMSNNGGYGFKVTGSYEQTGVVTVDVNNVAMSMHRVQILSIPQGVGTLDLNKFVLINNPDEDNITFQIETTAGGSQVLTLLNPNGTGGITKVYSEYWSIDLLKEYSADDIVDPKEFNITANSTLAAITDTTTDDWYQFYTVNEGGVTKLYVENLYCFDWNKYDTYLNANDAYDGDSSFYTAGQWLDGLAPHAGRYYEFRWKTMAINFSGAKTFGGTSLTLGDTTTAEWSEGATAEIAVYTSGADLTFPDLRLLENSRISVASGVTDLTLRGTIHFLANVMEGRFVANGTNFKLNMAATLLGGKNRILRLPGQTGCEFNVTGDATGYAGQLKAESGYTVGLGTTGLPTGTVNLADASTAVRSLDAKHIVPLKTLMAVDGATIKVDKSALGIAVEDLQLAGKVNLEFGASARADRIVVLSVPMESSLSASSFTVTSGFSGYTLGVDTKDDMRNLVYVKGSLKKQGASVILK